MLSAAPGCRQSFKSLWSGSSATTAWLLCSQLHTEKSQRPQLQTHTQKKVCPLCYFKQVQLTSEDLLMCWARHMLKYFPELTPDTNLTHTEPSALLPCPPTLHHLLRCSELALIRCSCNTGTMVSTRIMLRNIVRSCSKCAHSPKHAWDWSHSYSLCFSMLETKIRISSCVCQRWHFLP